MDPTAALAYELVQDALLTPQSRINLVLAALPVLHKHDVDLEEQCPICLVPFAAIFAEQEEAPDAQGPEQLPVGGLTKLGCGHVFCRRDLTEWVRSLHGNCPTCRHIFLDIRFHTDSDDESSDGGEYIPNPEELEDDDEDTFIDSFTEGDTDAEDFPVQEMDLDVGGFWARWVAGTPSNAARDTDMGDADLGEEEGSSEWGLTDGESESMSSSNGDLSMDAEEDEADGIAAASVVDDNVSVHENEADTNAAEERERLVPPNGGADEQDPK